MGMKIPDNRVASIGAYFHLQLDELYPKEEVDSFLFLTFSSLKGYSRVDLQLNKEERLSESELLGFIQVVKQLKQFKPVQYILGETEFYGLNFKVNDNVLIPRPETEELVDWIIKDNAANPAISILDIGTGSGCIAISLAKNLKNSSVAAIDVSEGALRLARENAALNEVEVQFLKKDILNTDRLSDFGKYKVIVSNPPYVLESEKAQMQPNVLQYEPEIALFVQDNDPLLFYRSILNFSKSCLSDNGQVYFEINEGKGDELVSLCKETGFSKCELRKDLRGKYRMLRCSIG